MIIADAEYMNSHSLATEDQSLLYRRNAGFFLNPFFHLADLCAVGRGKNSCPASAWEDGNDSLTLKLTVMSGCTSMSTC